MMALGLIGGVISAMGSMAAAQAAADSKRAQAAAYERQAAIERQTGEYESERQRDKSIRLISRQRTGYLTAGIALQGTPLDVIADTTAETELDVSAIKYGHEVKAQNFETQAKVLRFEADSGEQAGALGALSPIFKSLGSMGGGMNLSMGFGE